MKKTMKLIALTLVLTLSVLTLASCFFPNMDPEKAIASLKENDYKAAHDDIVIPIALKLLGVDGINDVVTGSKIVDDKLQHVTVIYFDDADAAKAAWEDVKEYAEKDKDDEDSDWKIGKFDKMIWYGTADAIKATY